MANQFLTSLGGIWRAAAPWESSAGAGDNTGPPAIADNCFLMVTSGNLLVDENTAAIGNLLAASYAGALTIAAGKVLDIDGTLAANPGAGELLGSGRMDVGGTIDLRSFACTAFTGTIRNTGGGGDIDPPTDAHIGGTLQVSGTGSLDMAGEFSCAAFIMDVATASFKVAATFGSGPFTMSDGSLTDNGTINIGAGGALAISGGSLGSYGGTFNLATGAHAIEVDPDVGPVAATLNLGSNTELTSDAIIDGAGFAVTADGAVIRGACIVQNVTASVSLWVPEGTDGGGNTNVDFTREASGAVRVPNTPSVPSVPSVA